MKPSLSWQDLSWPEVAAATHEISMMEQSHDPKEGFAFGRCHTPVESGKTGGAGRQTHMHAHT